MKNDSSRVGDTEGSSCHIMTRCRSLVYEASESRTKPLIGGGRAAVLCRWSLGRRLEFVR